ncbi:MAG: Uma2 family endonuclease [Armatimonadetes bacterium]|nr:Uma2 family endonuclease [Armatimonadota bacterium]
MAAEEATAQVVGATEAPLGPMTFDEFLAWAAHDEDVRAEWVDGRVVVMSPVSNLHQRLGAWLLRVLSEFVEEHALGEVFYAEYLMKNDVRPSGRLPDLMFVSASHAERVLLNFLDGVPDLAVEIVSPESFERDRADKFDEYALAGVREYWVLDPVRLLADFYQLDESGRYREVAPDADGVYHSREIAGLWVRVEWLWARRTLRQVLAAWGAA